MSILRRLSQRIRRDDRGTIAMIVALSLVPITAVSAVGVDGGRVWVERQRIQTAAESAAMAAAGVWANTGTACDATALQKVSQNAGSDASQTCSTTGNRSSGVLTVVATKDVAATFGKVIGRDSTTVSSTASVKVGTAGSASGLRPFGICEASPALTQWRAGGMTSTQIYSIYFSEITSAACGPVPGNWAVIDYNGSSNPTSEVQGWIDRGYSGSIQVGQRFTGQPGIPSPSLDLTSILGDQVLLPVFRYVSGSGSGSVFEIESFVGVTVLDDVLNGSASQRHLTVRFTKVALASAQMATDAQSFGVVTWRPCSLDGRGTCS